MPKELHPTQEKLIKLLQQNSEDPLTIRELQGEIGVGSTSTIHHHIKQLEKKGYLRRNPNNPADYQILEEADDEIVYLNMYGQAKCGPNGQILTGNPVDRVPVATKMLGFPSKDAFLIKAKGNSMHPKIKDGDIVIAKRSSNAADGNIVVCAHQGEAMIKRFQSAESGNIILSSENPDFGPILAQRDQLRIEGIVRGIISYTQIH